jgi:hypothetical protein
VRNQLDVVDLEMQRTRRSGAVVMPSQWTSSGCQLRGRPWPHGRETVERDFESLPFWSGRERSHEVRHRAQRSASQARLERPSPRAKKCKASKAPRSTGRLCPSRGAQAPVNAVDRPRHFPEAEGQSSRSPRAAPPPARGSTSRPAGRRRGRSRSLCRHVFRGFEIVEEPDLPCRLERHDERYDDRQSNVSFMLPPPACRMEGARGERKLRSPGGRFPWPNGEWVSRAVLVRSTGPRPVRRFALAWRAFSESDIDRAELRGRSQARFAPGILDGMRQPSPH